MKMKDLKILLTLVGFSLSPLAAQSTSMKGFADIQYHLSSDSNANVGFHIGQFDHYITAELTENISFLGETVFEYGGEWHVDVERLSIQYAFTDNLKLMMGKVHTPLGFWNNRFHHGAILMTSIERPTFLLFEDEGGILPIHTLGIMLSGSGIGSTNAGYYLLVGNGIGSNPAGDNDNWKALCANGHFSPMEGLELGLSGYFDKVYQGFEAKVVLDPFYQSIVMGDIVYRQGAIEFFTEGVAVNNNYTHSGKSLNSYGYYALGSYQIGSYRPYLKYDFLMPDETDPFFSPELINRYTAGVRYDLNFNVALKAQGYLQTVENESNYGFSTQLSAGF